MKDLSAMRLAPCVLLLAVMCAWPTTSASSAALRADLTHVDSGRGFTKRELLRRMAARSTARAASLHSSSARSQGVTVPVARGTTGKEDAGSEYNIHFGIGTPRPQPVVATLDTGSDLVWTQCSCWICFDQAFPALDPSSSSTFRDVSCSDPVCDRGGLGFSGCTVRQDVCFYVYAYGDNSTTFGTIAQDTFTFRAPNGTADISVPNLRFGCGQLNQLTFRTNETGIAGFGRGLLSLPSQLNVSRFSYCFTTIVEGRTSPVFLDTPDDLKAHATGPMLSTPFAPNHATSPTFYYLSLKGITVGKTRLPFNESVFALKDNGSGGTIIDSGTSFTAFPEAVFQSLQEAFVSQVSLPVANASDTGGVLCFSTAPGVDPKKVPVPKLILHLEGADWDLPRVNYMLDVEDDDGKGGALLCVVLWSTGESDMTIIGNFQQQNTHIVYDLEANKMVFIPARCDKM